MRIGATQLSHIPNKRCMVRLGSKPSKVHIPSKNRNAKNALKDETAAWHMRIIPHTMMLAPRYFATLDDG